MRGKKPSLISLVYSHAHYDHIGASVLFVQWARRVYPKARIDIYGTEDTVELIHASVSKRSVLPTIIVEGPRTLVLGPGLKVDMKIVGGHSGKDLALHIPRHGSESAVLMMVDIVFPRWFPFTGLAISINVARYMSVHDDLMKYDFDYFIGGHLDAGDRNDVSDSKRFVEDLLNASLAARKIVTLDVQAQAGLFNFSTPGTTEFGNVWFATLTAGRNIEATECAKIMIRKWGCRLGGVTETIFSHCFTTLTYLFVDY